MAVYVIHAGGWSEEGDDIDHVTRVRLEVGVRTKGLWFGYFVVTAGSLAPRTEAFQCVLMEEWLAKQYGVPRILIAMPQNPIADNSIAEVISARELIEEKGWWRERLYVSSSWFHIPRLWLIWRRYGQGLKPKFIWAWHGPLNLRWLTHEIGGIWVLLRGKAGPRYIARGHP